jgi:hypothetical protein
VAVVFGTGAHRTESPDVEIYSYRAEIYITHDGAQRMGLFEKGSFGGGQRGKARSVCMYVCTTWTRQDLKSRRKASLFLSRLVLAWLGQGVLPRRGLLLGGLYQYQYDFPPARGNPGGLPTPLSPAGLSLGLLFSSPRPLASPLPLSISPSLFSTFSRLKQSSLLP